LLEGGYDPREPTSRRLWSMPDRHYLLPDFLLILLSLLWSPTGLDHLGFADAVFRLQTGPLLLQHRRNCRPAIRNGTARIHNPELEDQVGQLIPNWDR